MNTIWYRFYSEKDSYQIPFNTTEISIGDIKKEIEKRRNMYKFPENFDLIFYDEENFEKIGDKDLIKPMKHLIIKRFPQYKRENNFVQIVRDPHDIPMNKINENGFRRGEPQKIIRYTEPLEKIKKKLNREMINKQFKCRLCEKFDDDTLFNVVISLCCKETFCLNCYNKDENKCPNPNCGSIKKGYTRNEAVINLVKKLLNILEKKEEEEKLQREAAIKQMNMAAFEVQGNYMVNNNGMINNQRNLNNIINTPNIDNSNIQYNITGINTKLLSSSLIPNNLYQLSNQNPSNSLLEGSQFFIIKSSNRENIEKSKKNSVWATTLVNSNKLNEAFKKGKVILIFSANGTQSYQGYAIMTSCTADNPSNLWQIETNIKLGGNFSVVWLCFCELSFSKAKHLQNTKKNNEPVNKSRDCTELPPIIGNELCKLCYEQEKKDLINNPQQAKVPINEQLIEKINEEIKNNRNKQLKKYNKSLNNNNEQNENNINNNKPNESINNSNINNSIPAPIPQIQNPNNMMPMPGVPFYIYNPYWNNPMQMHPHGQIIPNPMITSVINPQQQKVENDKTDKNKKEKERNREKDNKSKKSNKKRDRDRDRRNRSRERDNRSRSRNKSRSSRYSDSDSSDGRSKYSKSYK